MVMLEHLEGMLLCVHQSPDLAAAQHERRSAVAVLSFRLTQRGRHVGAPEMPPAAVNSQ